MFLPPPKSSRILNHGSLSEVFPPFLSFTDFGSGAPRAEYTQLVPGDPELLSHSARPCGHSVIHAV